MRKELERDEGEPTYEWLPLVLLLLHPVQAAILESLARVAMPLSVTQLEGIIAVDNPHYKGVVAYHTRRLSKVGLVEVVDKRELRGGMERFYDFPSK